MTLKMEEMSWLELQQSIEQGYDTVLILMGSIEQHGPHLPINTDTLIAEELGVRTAEKLGDALLAPVIRPGCSRHHMEFPGTVSISSRTFKEIVTDYCLAYEKHGFKNIVLIPYHGGNYEPVEEIETELRYKLKKSNLVLVADLEKSMQLMNNGMKEAGFDFEEPVIHAGATETSILMAIDEKLVRKERMEKGHIGNLSIANLFTKGLKYYTENGVLGDPVKANKEAGEIILESIVDWYVDVISEELSKTK
ncbi:MAG: creatininase family protein [Candidatus Saliniplasma sp.]